MIFDCDGVLVDSEPITCSVMAACLTEIGLPMTTEQCMRDYVGSWWPDVVEDVEAKLGHALPEGFTEQYRARQNAALAEGVEPVAGVVEMLDRISGAICVASNGTATKMEITLASAGLAERFEGRIFSANEVERGKPAPDLFLHAAASARLRAAGVRGGRGLGRWESRRRAPRAWPPTATPATSRRARSRRPGATTFDSMAELPRAASLTSTPCPLSPIQARNASVSTAAASAIRAASAACSRRRSTSPACASRGRDCLVVGGGEIGLEKVEGLLACDGKVTLVAPEANDALRAYAEEGSITWEQREYRAADLEGKFLAIAATDDTDVNIAVYDDAERRAMLVNIVDVPSLCNFILPAIVRTGPLAIAISTAGASPALAKRIKREIADGFGEPYARLAVLLNEARGWAKATLPTYQDRKAFFEEIVNGDPDPIELIRDGRDRDVVALIEAAKQPHAAAQG